MHYFSAPWSRTSEVAWFSQLRRAFLKPHKRKDEYDCKCRTQRKTGDRSETAGARLRSAVAGLDGSSKREGASLARTTGLHYGGSQSELLSPSSESERRRQSHG